MYIREIKKSDADNFISLLRMIDYENDYMVREPGEYFKSTDEMEEEIDAIYKKNQCCFVLEKDCVLYGFIRFTRSTKIRLKHKGELTIGLVEEVKGLGYGKALMTTLEGWAVENGVERLDLKVANNNERAVNLYKNLRFEITGEYKKDVKINEREYLDFIHMSKFLG